MKKRRWLLVVTAGVLLLAAGVSAALFMSHRRDVTTTSEAAFDAYKDGVANENRFYFKEARLAYARALELDPSFAMAMVGLARQSKEDDQRNALLKRAAREKGRLSERERLHVEMALAFSERRQEDGVRIAREIHEKYPTDTRSVQILAGSELMKGNSDRGIKIFEELLSVDPNNAEAYNQIGYYYGYRGDYDKAMENLKRYQFIAADNANPFDSLGEVQAYSGHYNEAVENLNRALAIRPDFVDSVKNLAVVAEGTGDYVRAVETYEKAAAMTDRDDVRVGFLVRAMRSAFYAKNTAEVLRLAAKAKAVKAGGKYAEVDAAYIDAVVALAEGRPGEALRMVDAIEARRDELIASEKHSAGYKPFFPHANMLRALALEAQGKGDEALVFWKLNANPPTPFENFEQRRSIYEARARVALALAKKGELDEAEKLIAENRKWNASWAPTREAEATVAELRREKVLAASK